MRRRQRLPATYFDREFVDAGGLMAYGVSYPDLYRRAATFVDKIFKGAKPADLPIEQPIKFDLIVNLKAAKALGLVIPETFLDARRRGDRMTSSIVGRPSSAPPARCRATPASDDRKC